MEQVNTVNPARGITFVFRKTKAAGFMVCSGPDIKWLPEGLSHKNITTTAMLLLTGILPGNGRFINDNGKRPMKNR